MVKFFLRVTFFLLVISFSNAGELKIGIVQEWNQFNPITVNLASTAAVSNFLIRGMVVRDARGRLIPDLAKEIPSLENKLAKIESKNGKQYVVAFWEIKENAKWGDGKEVTCKDWEAGWKIGMDEGVAVAERGIFSNIDKIEWSESNLKKCKVTYVNAGWNFDRDIPPLVPASLEIPIFEKFKAKPQAYEQNSIYVTQPTNPALYNGPYVVSEYVIGSHFTLIPNKYFFGKSPQIEKVSFRHLGDTSTLRANLKTKNINAVSAVGFPPDLAILMSSEFEKGKENDFKVVFQDSPIFQGIFFNLEKETLHDKSVRKALELAIDKNEIVKAFFENKLLPANTFIAPSNPQFVKRAGNFSIKEAIELLDKDGWKLNKSGVREKNGKLLSLEFRTSAGIKILETIQTYICSQYSKIGVQCLVKNQPPRIFLGESVPKGDFDLAMFGQTFLPDASFKGTFGSSDIPKKENSFTGGNISRFSDKKVDKLSELFDKEWNNKKREKAVEDLERIVIEERPFIPLYHRKEAFVIPSKLEGFQADISGTNYLFPELWILK